MKLRYLKTISTEYVPVNMNQSNSLWGVTSYYTKKDNVKTVLQFYDEEFSSWVDVPTVVERKGEK